MYHHRAARYSQCIFLSTMALLYLAFMLCDFFDGELWLSSMLKYCSIFACFLYSLICSGYTNVVTKGLFFTAVADIFLLFTNYYFFGVFSFCVVQFIYFYRIRQWNKNIRNTHIIYRIIISIAVIFLLARQVSMDWVLGITVVYFTNFIANLLLLLRTHSIMRDSVLFSQFFRGMGLFFLCDICVGISNLTSYITLSVTWMDNIFYFASFGMWGFYLPGQVLIALSCREKAK